MGRVSTLDSAREARLKRTYGISIADYNGMLKRQGGVCAGCGWSPKPGQRRLHVEHNHRTGRVRGLVCWRCNSAIKKLRDDPQIAYNLAVFLARGDGKGFKVLPGFSPSITVRQPASPTMGIPADDPRGDS